VANLIADAASDRLVLDLTAQVTREVGSPSSRAIRPKSAGVPGLRQAGPIGPLARDLHAAARRVSAAENVIENERAANILRETMAYREADEELTARPDPSMPGSITDIGVARDAIDSLW
jgi:hypothetical protein